MWRALPQWAQLLSPPARLLPLVEPVLCGCFAWPLGGVLALRPLAAAACQGFLPGTPFSPPPPIQDDPPWYTSL